MTAYAKNLRASLAVLSACVVMASTQTAHAGPLDRQAPFETAPANSLYILAGAAISYVAPMSASAFVDTGAEVSVHRFLAMPRMPYGIFRQFGVGGLFQAQAGLPLHDPLSTSHVRFGLGAQITFGVIGIQAGLQTRARLENYADNFGAFTGVFASIGVFSAAFQAEFPIANFESGPTLPIALSAVFTLKWPFEIVGSARSTYE